MEIGKLEATFTANTGHFDAGVHRVESSIHKLTGTFKEIGAASVVLEGPFGGVSSRLRGLSTLATELGGSMGLAGVAIAGLGAVSVGIAGGIFELTKHVAEAGEQMFHLHETTNFSVETLSALKNAAELSGGSIESLTMGLGIFDKNVEQVNQGNEKLGATFRALKIDTNDNESALRGALRALMNVKDGGQQTALAMQIFGRSGKEVVAVLKAMHGDLDGAIEKFKDAGTLMSGESAEAAHKFSVKLKELEQQFTAVTRQIGEKFMPIVIDALQKVSNALDSNKAHAASWADSVVSAVKFAADQIATILAGAQSVINDFNWAVEHIKKVPGQQEASDQTSRLGFGVDLITRTLLSPAALTDAQLYDKDTRMSTTLGSHLGFDEQKGGRTRIPGGGGGGGRGGGGADPAIAAKRMAELQLQAVIAGLQAESDANKRSLDLRRRDFNDYSTQYMTIENRRHAAVIKGLDDEEKAAKKLKKGQDVALQEVANKRTEENTQHEQNRNKVLDERAALLDRMNAFIAEQDKQVTAVTYETDHWQQSIDDLVESMKAEGVTLEDNYMRQRLATAQIGRDTEARKRQLEVIKEGATRLRRAVFATGNETRPRIATDDLLIQRAQERFDKMREEMMGLGQDLTSVFSRSIGDGFDQGAKHGLATLAQGLLDIVQNIFLKKMAEGLGNLLTNFMGGGKGGGWLGKLLGIGLGAAAGGAGGGGTSGGGGWFAKGGYLQPGQWGMAGEHGPEPIYGGKTGMTVIPNQSQPIINNYTIQLPPVPKGGYSSPKSQRQMAEHLMAALQGART